MDGCTPRRTVHESDAASALRLLEEQYAGLFVHVPCAIAATDEVLTFHESQTNESGSLLEDHVNITHDPTTSYDVEAVALGSLLERIGRRAGGYSEARSQRRRVWAL